MILQTVIAVNLATSVVYCKPSSKATSCYIVSHPREAKYTHIRLGNMTFHTRAGQTAFAGWLRAQ